jgi:hypothetical protein
MGIYLFEVCMRLYYALCFLCVFSISACREAKTTNEETINLKEYESTLERSEELSDKEQELRQLELDLQQKEEELSRQKTSIPDPQIIDQEPPRTTYSGVQGDYPEASKQLLTANELRYTSKEVLVIMRNEIFARHGYIFKRADLHNHFVKKPWYNPQHNDVSHLLTQVEKDNIRLIKAFEDL